MREQDQHLFDFCVAQNAHFDQAGWLSQAKQDSIKIAALLLSSASWYDRSRELNALCNRCGWSKALLPALVKANRFDCARFMSMLKTRLSIQ